MQAKKIAKNTGFLFSTEILNKILSFLLVVIITRYLGSKGFGIYSFAFAFISLFTMFSHLGLSTYIFREIAKDKSQTKKLVNNVLTIKYLVTLVSFFIAFTIAKFWPKTNEIILVILLVMAYDVFGLFNLLNKTIFSAYERNELWLISTMIEKILALSLGFYALAQGFGLHGLLIALILSRIITAIYSYIVSYKNFVKISFSIDLKLWKNILKNSLPFWFTLIFSRVYHKTDTVMLSGMKNYTVTGWYNASSRLIEALSFIPDVIVRATFPAMSRFHHVGEKYNLQKLYKKIFYYLLAIGIPSCIGIFLLSHRIIFFVYKEQFAESGIILQILSWSLLFIFLNKAMGYLLNSINKQHLFTISSGVCAASNVIMNFALIPKFSYIGAAFATVATQFINFCFLYYFAMQNGYALNLLKVSYKPIISTIVMTFAIINLKSLPIIFIIPIASIIYFVSLLIIGGFGRDEFILIKSFFKRKSM